MKNVKALFKKIVLGIGLILIAWATYPIYRELFLIFTNYPVYLWFDYQAEQLNPQFDALNEDVVKEFPAPLDGAVLESRKIIGTHFMATRYGRNLRLYYRLPEARPYQDVTDYYIAHLTAKNWKVRIHNEDFSTYFKSEGCIEINPNPVGNNAWRLKLTDAYEISIKQDFFKQPFSQKFPNFPTVLGMNAFTLYSFGEASFIMCTSYFTPPINK
jgi:hypothetical protein